MAKSRIGYVPEHFSTPLAFAQKYYGLDADLEAVPLGTGVLTARLKTDIEADKLDVAIGLTEGFVADLGKTKAAGEQAGYGLCGTYVESPLRWALIVGSKRDDLRHVEDLKGKKVAVSRIGSGSYVMSYCLADTKGWLDPSSSRDPFEVVPIGDFAALRKAVNDGTADFFMWEYFTTRAYFDSGEVKHVGDIETPWSSWMIAARNSANASLPDMMEKINKGIARFKEHPDEAVEYITTNMHYSKDDAEKWMQTVEFPDEVKGVSHKTVESTISILRKAGVLKGDVGGPESMITIERDS